MADIPIVGAVIKWARDFRRLSLDEAAQRIGVSTAELRAFEDEEAQPSLTEFEAIAHAYRLPTSTLFRRTPPHEPPEPSDFRTFEGAPHQESFDFRVALSNVRALQAILRTLQTEDDQFQRVNLREYDFASDPFQQGERERRAIGVTVADQLDWKSNETFRRWRSLIEQLGIAVYMQKFPTDDCRGWSTSDNDSSPAIIINKQDVSQNAQIFTLIHEYAHLLIRRPGISDLRPDNPVEVFCNRFAGAFLMPIDALKTVLPEWPSEPIRWNMTTITYAAARLKVSAQALAIRLEELQKAPRNFNRIFTFKPKERPQRPDSRPNPVVVRLSEIGARFIQSVIGALDREVIDSVHASQALGISSNNFPKARAYIERFHSLAAAR
jgi:Zn-dependent peptidase ImmA (M78 family)/DNA-binding XRE family transcriptional regulator